MIMNDFLLAFAGSRSSGMLAQCWASMVAMGEDGYMKNTKAIMDSVRVISRSLETVAELEVIGQTEAMIVCFRSKDPKVLNIYAVGDGMSKKGWSLNLLQNPASIHLCVTAKVVGKEDLLISVGPTTTFMCVKCLISCVYVLF